MKMKRVKKAPVKAKRVRRVRRVTAPDLKAMESFAGLTEEVRVPIEPVLLETVKRAAVMAGTTPGTVLSVLLAMAAVTAIGSRA